MMKSVNQQTSPFRLCVLYFFCLWLVLHPFNGRAEEKIINQLTTTEKKEGWKLLFDGKTTNGWRGINQKDFPAKGWKVEEGMLIVNATDEKESGNGGDIISTEQYGDFILDWDWKMMTKGGNSGVKYVVKEGLSDNNKYGAGLEYQILDDENFSWMKDGRMKPGDYRTLAALYEIYPATNRKPKQLGEWNNSRIVVKGKHVEHWLNGIRVLSFERGSADFRKKVAESKFSKFENFGEAATGYILLQDHGTKIAFRNIKIKETPIYPLFVFNNALLDEPYNNPETQAALLQSLGYKGMEKKGIDGVEETLGALDKHGLKLYTMYLKIDLDNTEEPYDKRLKWLFGLLEGRGTIPWFYIASKKYKPSSLENDTLAVPILQEIADMAALYGIKVMIYPHVNNWVDNVEDAIRVAAKVNRRNLGISFNLCHYLANQGTAAASNFIPLVEKAMPYLFAISLNGADQPDEHIMQSKNVWKHFIRPLGEGNYDIAQYLRAFKERGFSGPVGLQCYSLKGDKAALLTQSMYAWKSLWSTSPGL